MNDRQSNLQLHQSEMAAGAVELHSAPLTLQVEPTSVCNLECGICGRQYWDATKNPPGEMPAWVIAKIEPLLPRLVELVVGGYAEATLAKSLWPLLEAARKAECPTRLITNGTRLDLAMCRRLVEAGLAHLVVSIDGAREPTLRKSRGIGLEQTLGGFDRMSDAARELGVAAPRFQISFTATRSNVAELAELVDLAADRGVTEISAGHLKIYSKELDCESLFHDPAGARQHLKRAQERAAARGVVLSVPGFEKRNADCMMPFRMLFVKWNGKVLGCCSAVFENDKFNFPVGDLSEKSLLEIWNDAAILSYRRAQRRQGEYPAQCVNCAFRHDTYEAHLRLL
ncbi:MAG: SPASM domain-containing protein [Candidatus Wallbacteria bacterium]|nr:SPASM domain-containing protein [Candidatus Wallbacteria bacterium]